MSTAKHSTKHSRGRRSECMGGCTYLWIWNDVYTTKEDGSDEKSLIKWLTPSSEECGENNLQLATNS